MEAGLLPHLDEPIDKISPLTYLKYCVGLKHVVLWMWPLGYAKGVRGYIN